MSPVHPPHTPGPAVLPVPCLSKTTAKRTPSLVVLLAVAACLAIHLSSCASVPAPPVPDGSIRAPVNDPQRLAEYAEAIQQQQHHLQQEQQTQAELTRLRTHVEWLRSALKRLLDGPATHTAASPSAHISSDPLPQRSVERQGSAVVMRLFYPFGETRVENATHTARMQAWVYRAARAAQRIEITGHTDSATADPGNRWVAMQRAFNARQALLDHGVPPARVVTRHHAAGHFLVAGTDPAARASNRRVELVFHGDMEPLLAALASTGELNRSLP